MTKKIYLETFKKCPASLGFPLLTHFLDIWFEDNFALSTLSATTMSPQELFS